jgi:hypothetical protein
MAGSGHLQDYPWVVDRDALARAGRRAQAEEALEFERERESELRRQVAELVLEEEGPRVDAAVFATLDDEDVRRVRAALGEVEDDVEDEDPFVDDTFVALDFDDPGRDEEEPEDEGSRLQRAIEDCRRTQAALERYLAALDEVPAATEAQ